MSKSYLQNVHVFGETIFCAMDTHICTLPGNPEVCEPKQSLNGPAIRQKERDNTFKGKPHTSMERRWSYD